jgi:hypothetical protein
MKLYPIILAVIFTSSLSTANDANQNSPITIFLSANNQQVNDSTSSVLPESTSTPDKSGEMRENGRGQNSQRQYRDDSREQDQKFFKRLKKMRRTKLV